MPAVSPEFRVPRSETSIEEPNGSQPGQLDETVMIMGLPFHGLDQRTLIRRFRDGVRSGTGGWIVTPNLDILRQFTTDAENQDLVLAASHRVADGMPIVWASRLAGAPLPERVNGTDLAYGLPEAAAEAGVPVLLLGGNPGVAEAAARRLEDLNPDLGRVASYCPPFGYENDPAELARIRTAARDARPVLVLIGLPFPKQQKLIRWLRSELPQAWFAAVGVSFSFIAGEQPRAPVVLQRLGLEWMHRLCHEPRRLFKRYVIQGIPFSLRLFSWALRQRLREPPSGRRLMQNGS
jgi:N-acetylglucosaminyldiphosphoundecaprenol N-acetyl-beta-D-mannosaminyltransferase